MRLRVAALLTCAPPPVNVNFPLTQLPNVILCCHHRRRRRCCSSTGHRRRCWRCSYPFQDASSTFYLRCLMNYEAPPAVMMRGKWPLPLLFLQEGTKGSNRNQKEKEMRKKPHHPPKKDPSPTSPPPFPPPPCDHNITKTFMPLLGKSPGKITLYKY